MLTAAGSQREREELESLLQSEFLHRAPNLSSFLRYVCERYFAGEADQIKEYNIAVEALGRSPEFDQKKDSIVRVEAHRLRKRLLDYYAGPGAGHSIRLVIPSGQYAPQFVCTLDSEAAEQLSEQLPRTGQRWEGFPENAISEEIRTHALQPASVNWRERWSGRVLLAASLVVVGAIAIPAILGTIQRANASRLKSSTLSAVPESWQGDFRTPVSREFRMLAGYHGPAYSDRQGHKWEPDAYFQGGRSVSLDPGKLIEASPDPHLLQSSRDGDFHYDIPLRSDIYELHLYFSETSVKKVDPSEGEDVRSFRVSINGQTRLDLFDVFSEAGGPNRLQMRVFKDITPGKDGSLHLQFSHQSGQPFLNALEILPSLPGKIRPIRIVARKTPVTDAKGRVWSADEFVVGGHLTERTDSVVNAEEKDLFEGERFGNFAYHLAVAPGKYRVTLRFAETYFGSTIRNAPPFEKASRLFDVRANGVALLKDFDIGLAAGGPNRGIEKTFENIEPNAQGLIILEFHPTRNYACVNAIEVEETN